MRSSTLTCTRSSTRRKKHMVRTYSIRTHIRHAKISGGENYCGGSRGHKTIKMDVVVGKGVVVIIADPRRWVSSIPSSTKSWVGAEQWTSTELQVWWTILGTIRITVLCDWAVCLPWWSPGSQPDVHHSHPQQAYICTLLPGAHAMSVNSASPLLKYHA